MAYMYITVSHFRSQFQQFMKRTKEKFAKLDEEKEREELYQEQLSSLQSGGWVRSLFFHNALIHCIYFTSLDKVQWTYVLSLQIFFIFSRSQIFFMLILDPWDEESLREFLYVCCLLSFICTHKNEAPKL